MTDHAPATGRAKAASLPVRVADGAIWLYQKTVSPALTVALPSCGCRFAPTCSHYAREALREHGFFRGIGLSVSRLIRCGPWHPGGIDPVPRRCVKVASSSRSGSLPTNQRVIS